MEGPPVKGSRQSGSRAVGQSPQESKLRGIAVWKESQAIAEHVAELVSHLPRDGVANSIGSQLVRAAGSIPANITEGYGRFSQPAYRNHLSIARGSAFEAESWVDLLIRRKYVSPADGAQLLAQCDAIQRMLTTRMRGLGSASQTYAIREEGIDYEA